MVVLLLAGGALPPGARKTGIKKYDCTAGTMDEQNRNAYCTLLDSCALLLDLVEWR